MPDFLKQYIIFFRLFIIICKNKSIDVLLQEWNETAYPMLDFECGKGKVIRQNWEMKEKDGCSRLER